MTILAPSERQIPEQLKNGFANPFSVAARLAWR
jgi:hypothetical protein